jgi:hypothetical protein
MRIKNEDPSHTQWFTPGTVDPDCVRVSVIMITLDGNALNGSLAA